MTKRGVTLVELLTAAIIGSFVLMGLGSFIIMSTDNFNNNFLRSKNISAVNRISGIIKRSIRKGAYLKQDVAVTGLGSVPGISIYGAIGNNPVMVYGIYANNLYYGNGDGSAPISNFHPLTISNESIINSKFVVNSPTSVNIDLQFKNTTKANTILSIPTNFDVSCRSTRTAMAPTTAVVATSK